MAAAHQVTGLHCPRLIARGRRWCCVHVWRGVLHVGCLGTSAGPAPSYRADHVRACHSRGCCAAPGRHLVLCRLTVRECGVTREQSQQQQSQQKQQQLRQQSLPRPRPGRLVRNSGSLVPRTPDDVAAGRASASGAASAGGGVLPSIPNLRTFSMQLHHLRRKSANAGGGGGAAAAAPGRQSATGVVGGGAGGAGAAGGALPALPHVRSFSLRGPDFFNRVGDMFLPALADVRVSS